MDSKEFDNLCMALDSGEEKFVENLGSHEVGKVLFCSGNRLEVEIGQRRETWASEFCKEAGGRSAAD